LLFKPYFSEILALPKARVPIVKFQQPKYKLHCDIGINNHLACRNSQLIREYMQADSRARDLCLLVKYWAKQRKINDPYRGTLSSYCYVIMVIHFLMNGIHVSPPILPCLQTLDRNPSTDAPVVIDGFDCWYQQDREKYRDFGKANSQSLGELLMSFFRLYSHEFNFSETVISVRAACYMEKKKKVWSVSTKKDKHLVREKRQNETHPLADTRTNSSLCSQRLSFSLQLCVEDPFDVTHNLARGVDPAALYEIRGEFMRAFRMLASDGASFEQVCTPYTKEWRGA
jgi:DNA polymerase sigma